MIANGWFKRAALMQHWLDGSGETDKTTITMQWDLGYQRAKAACDRIVKDKLYINTKAQSEIAKLAEKAAKGSTKFIAFGSIKGSVEMLDRDYIQFRAVRSASDPVDDMFAAIGRFPFRVLVEGERCTEINGRYRIDKYKIKK